MQLDHLYVCIGIISIAVLLIQLLFSVKLKEYNRYILRNDT